MELILERNRLLIEAKNEAYNGAISTHVSMDENYRGKYSFNRKTIQSLFDIIGNYKIHSLAEIPLNYLPVLIDIDIKKESKELISLHDFDDILTVIKIYNKVLKTIVENIKESDLLAVVLEKAPYWKKEYIISHGYHIHYPNIFLSKSDHLILLEEIKNSNIEGLDSGYIKAPWLMYGGSKSHNLESYKISHIIDYNLNNIDLEIAFRNYEIYDLDEQKIKLESKQIIEKNLPRILSILPLGRKYFEIKDNFKKKQKLIYVTDIDPHEDFTQDDPEPLEEPIVQLADINDDLIKELLDVIPLNQNYTEWYTMIIIIHKIYTGNQTGLAILEDYFISHPGYKVGENEKVYRTLNHSLNKFSIYSLIKRAKEFDKEKVDSILKTYNFSSKSTKEQINTWCLEQNIKRITETPKYESIVVKSKYVESSYYNKIDPRVSRHIVIQAGLGSGKSTSYIKHINETNYDTIIVLTPRVTYADAIHGRLRQQTNYDFKHYKHLKGDITHPYIICQFESIHRLDIDLSFGNSLFILDEIESIITQIASITTNKRNHLQNINTFKSILSESSKSILCDAFITNRTLQLLKDLKISYEFYKFITPVTKRNYEIFEIDREDKEKCFNIFVNKILSQLQDNKKIFIVSTSKDKLESIYLKINNAKFSSGKKNILIYHSETKGKEQTKILSDVNTHWSNCDAILTTTTITVGINYDIPNVFDKCFIYISSMSKNNMRDVAQTKDRIRHFIDPTTTILINDTIYSFLNINNYPIYHKYIEQQTEIEIQTTLNTFSSITNKTLNDNTEQWLKNIFNFTKLERNLSIRYPKQLFTAYILQSITNEDITEPLIEENTLDLVVEDDDLDTTDINPITLNYYDIPDITNIAELKQLLLQQNRTLINPIEYLKELIKKEQKTEQDKLIIKKYNFNKLFDSFKNKQETNNAFLIYFTHGYKRFRLLQLEKEINKFDSEYIQKIINPTHLDQPIIATTIINELKLVLDIVNTFQLDHSQNIGKIVNRDFLNQHSKLILDEFTTRVKTICRDRSTNTKEKDTTIKAVELANRVLTTFTFSKLKRGERKRKKIKGKTIEMSDFVLEYNDKAKQGDAILPLNTFDLIKRPGNKINRLIENTDLIDHLAQISYQESPV